MKKILNILLAAILMMTVSMPLSAQDDRQRTPETIVQDVLALMPTQNQSDFNREMNSLAQAAPKSIELLVAMLQPAEKACNNKVEYAISGVVAYASNTQYRDAVKEGLANSISKTPDQTAKDFIQQQLRLFSDQNDVEYTEHEGAAPYAAAYDKLKSLGKDAGAEVVKAVKSKDHAYRMQALKFATDYNLVNDELASQVAKKYNSCKEEGKVDIINWLGDNKVTNQKPLMMKALKKGGAPAVAAIEALGRVGGQDAEEALIAQLGGEYNEQAFAALQSFNANLDEKVASSLSTATGAQQLALLKLADSRRIKKVSGQVFDLLNNSDAEVSKAAREALSGVVTNKDASRVASLLDKANNDELAAYKNAFDACLNSLNNNEKFQAINAEMQKAQNKDRFYDALAATNTDESVEVLQQANNDAALKALMKSSNYKASAPLLEAAKNGNEEALNAYVALVNANEGNKDNRYNLLAEALKLAKNSDAKKNIINSMAETPTRSAFITVGEFLNDKDLAITAAYAEKQIQAKSLDDIEVDLVKKNLNKSIDALKARGAADDMYAVDAIKKALAELDESSPLYVLSDEEKKEGFEVLFDGTNLDNFVGNKTNYVPINGAIYVTADYGSGGNLYTVKEYRNFVFRFEFCFMRPGVNNGIGVRTPMGVDAAYDGMCEVQVLDHDDPIYSGLREYQVHGSVYGVIPAKRIKHKGLGEWGTEEIRVEGDHVTVTVNGEVIVDGDIREACQGHNVDPNGGDSNPYTVDHRNHPGMFNQKGHIGFLGHGTGVKFRNVRVLDLGDKDAKLKSKSKSKKK